MIFITGDIYGDLTRFSVEAFPEQREIENDNTEEHYCIVLGDFGLICSKEQSNREKYWLEWLDNKPFIMLFIDGNHKNFDRLNLYPVMEFAGGKVHKISDKVYHLMRGEVFTLNDISFFAFGGASSHDVSDGILDGADESYLEEIRINTEYKKLFSGHTHVDKAINDKGLLLYE